MRVPPTPDAKATFHEVSRRAGDFAIVGVAAQVVMRDGSVSDARLGVTGVEFAPVRLGAAERALIGSTLDAATIDEAASRAAAAVDPRGDANATPEHRRELVEALVRRAVQEVAR